jgi:hypothetical protein
MSITLRKINCEEVKPIKTKLNTDERPVLGGCLFPEVYANIFICAKKKSGKSMCIAKILKSCSDKDTKIIAFCSTIHKDPVWGEIKKWAKKKGITFEGFADLVEDKVNILDAFLNKLGSEADGEEEDISESESEPEHDTRNPRVGNGGKVKDYFGGGNSEEESDREDSFSSEEEDNSTKMFGITSPQTQKLFNVVRSSLQPKKKYRVQDYILIFDDLSHALKMPSIASLLKKNRHYRLKTIISSQYIHDLKPESLKQIDYLLLYKGLTEDKLEKVRKDADLSVTGENLDKVYHHSTKEPYNFLYIDTRHDVYRKNFNQQYNIPIV